MDEMRINGKYMKALAGNLISKAFFKKFGVPIELQINDLYIQFDHGKIIIRGDIYSEMEHRDFLYLVAPEMLASK